MSLRLSSSAILRMLDSILSHVIQDRPKVHRVLLSLQFDSSLAAINISRLPACSSPTCSEQPLLDLPSRRCSARTPAKHHTAWGSLLGCSRELRNRSASAASLWPRGLRADGSALPKRDPAIEAMYPAHFVTSIAANAGRAAAASNSNDRSSRARRPPSVGNKRHERLVGRRNRRAADRRPSQLLQGPEVVDGRAAHRATPDAALVSIAWSRPRAERVFDPKAAYREV
jgi:hypothetical protein